MMHSTWLLTQRLCVAANQRAMSDSFPLGQIAMEDGGSSSLSPRYVSPARSSLGLCVLTI
jgi:hypothetical protein